MNANVSIKNRKKCLQITETMPGEWNRFLAVNYCRHLASRYMSQERYEEAEELFIKCLQIREKMSEWTYFEAQTEYMGLSFVYEKLGEYETALTCEFIVYKILYSITQVRPLPKSAVCTRIEKLYAQWNPKGDYKQWLEENLELS